MCSRASPPLEKLLAVFRIAAERVPAYAAVLRECGIDPSTIKTVGDFERLPILDKHKMFQRFPMHELCLDGRLGKVSWVLTSSGQSGIFSFGLYDPPAAADYKRRLDESLDAVFSVSRRSTLLLNCLPMGVKLYSEHCALGETSVRPDMACGLMKAFASYYEQVIIVGETAFVKHLLETGVQRGIEWQKHLVHVILGEEMVAENARKYLEGILGTRVGSLATGLVGASMGVGELGLNLFCEVPPIGPLMLLRRALHENRQLRRLVLGPEATTVPALFGYDPDRCYVEFVGGRLVLTMLDPARPVPMVRYTTDDDGDFLHLPESLRGPLEAAGVPYDPLREVPLVMIRGRGTFAAAAGGKVYPEEIKEGLYHDPELARLTTANFRLVSNDGRVEVRIQLAPGVQAGDRIREAFAQAIAHYVTCPVRVTCHAYQAFGSGMSVDYERKNDYLRPSPCGADSADPVRPGAASLWTEGKMGQDADAAGQFAGEAGPRRRLSNGNRRLAMLKRTGLFGPDTSGAEITRACDLRDLSEAYRLVHDVFVSAGYIEPQEGGMRIRVFEAMPDTATFIARRDGRVVGVLSLVIDTPELGLPSDGTFKRELDEFRARGIRLAETTNQAMVPSLRGTALTTQLMRCCSAQSVLEDRDRTVISVSPSHVGFYELLGFEVHSDVRSYSSRHDDPVILMGLDITGLKRPHPGADPCGVFVADYLSFKNPFAQKVREWKTIAAEGFYAGDQLRRVFVDESRLLSNCTDAQRAAIRKRWGEGTYMSVSSPRHGPRRPPRAADVSRQGRSPYR